MSLIKPRQKTHHRPSSGALATRGLPAAEASADINLLDLNMAAKIGLSFGSGEDAAAAAAAPTMPTGLKLLSIANDDGSETLGAVTAAGVVDVRSAAQALDLDSPLTLDQLLREGSAAKLEALVSAALKDSVAIVPESEVKFGRLFANPGKIVCVGLNYRKHAEEVGQKPPRVPPLFNKYNNALAAHNSVVTLPAADIAYKIDYETELLVVIGKAARNVSAADALSYVAGYSVGHDLSARDLQLELPAVQWMLGKTLDGFAPIGPYFVGADLVPNPDDLKLETRVNGEVVQEWSTNDFIFNVQEVVAYISKHFTLNPGDIIFTGTPQGVIVGKAKQDQHWLKAGDEIVSTIESLGELKFKLA
jgi:2-keto-4-pentenoate hydratase/2-oxohepta-3-ene-1,7-dioic acid hydratase in catechol pathway